MVLPQNVQVPTQQSLAFFSAGEPASAFEGSTGVVVLFCVAGRGMVEDGVRVLFPRLMVFVSTGKVAGPVVGGTTQTFPGFETVLRDVDAMQIGGPAPAAEIDFDDAQHVHVPRGAAAQPCSAVAVPSGPPCLAGSDGPLRSSQCSTTVDEFQSSVQ